MEFDLNDDERALRDEARRFLEREAPAAYARAMMDAPEARPADGRDDVWRAMAGQGWMGLAIPEAYGGAGLGFVAQALLVEEMGRVVLPGPYLATVLAGQAILVAGTDAQRKALLAGIAAGERVATLARGDAVEAGVDRIDGTASFVLDGVAAEHFVVLAGDRLWLSGRHGVTAEPVATLDATRSLARVRFDAAQAEPMEGSAVSSLDRAIVMLAAEMVGASARVLELSVEYAKSREQFGRPIGSFQAVKHRAADMALDVESARNAVWYAAWAIEREHPDASLAASTAKAVAGDAAKRVTAGGIQIHGGIGFTWEHDMHLFFKRVRVDEMLFGDATEHRERAAGLLARRYGAT